VNRARRPPLQHPLADSFDRAVASLGAALHPETTRHYRGTVRNFLSYLSVEHPAVDSLTQLRREPHILGWMSRLRSQTPALTTASYINLLIGLPFSVRSGIDNSLSAINADRANMVGNPGLSSDRSKAQKVQQWFNTQAFVANALGTFGTSGRNLLIKPGVANVDFSVVKIFPIHKGPFAETQALHFRAEFFNLMNHANFNNPNATVNASTYGRILSAGDPRIVQFGLKFVY
jgi:hypothetical protein